MLDWLRGSLPARAGLAVALIATLAVLSAFSAVLIAWKSVDDAAAINTAGSLRMMIYRLNWQLEANAAPAALAQSRDELQNRLGSSAIEHMLDDTPDNPTNQLFAALQQQWQEQLLPALAKGDKHTFARHSLAFAEGLETFVLQLQKHSERRQGWQQNIQGAGLLITVVILLVGMYELHNSVLTPLQQLVSTAERFRAGDLDARIQYRSRDELGRVADSFNAMADAIEHSHLTLASRVAEKTEQLAKSNAALELLYQSSRSIASAPANIVQLDALLDSFQERLPGLRLSLCLKGQAEQALALQGHAPHAHCVQPDCDDCPRQNGPSTLLYPINSQGKTLGEMRAYYQDHHIPHPWERQLIEALANLVGTSLSLERQREQDHRLLLLDERTTIARELHDSLAQALSYMKLQVSRLQTLIRRGDSREDLLEVSDELRDGLNNAYRQLRELLTTFRLQIQDGGIDEALQDTAHEFAKRGEIVVQFSSISLPLHLSAAEQINLLQIAREALSNCVRHAQARQAWVHLQMQDSDVELLIEDDGVGISAGFDHPMHHGLNIMRERARSLGGDLTIHPRQPQGTRIRLRFRPGFLREAAP